MTIPPADASANPQGPAPIASQAGVSVSAALQQELDQVSASAQQEKIADLTRMATLLNAPLTPLKEYAGFYATPLVVIALFTFVLFIVVVLGVHAKDWENPAIYVVFSGPILLLLVTGLRLRLIILARRHPVLLSPQGLQLSDVPRVVPWTAIGEVSVSTSYGNIFMPESTFLNLKSPSGEDIRAICGQNKSRHIKYSMRKFWTLRLAGLSKDRDKEEAVTTFLNY